MLQTRRSQVKAREFFFADRRSPRLDVEWARGEVKCLHALACDGTLETITVNGFEGKAIFPFPDCDEDG